MLIKLYKKGVVHRMAPFFYTQTYCNFRTPKHIVFFYLSFIFHAKK